MASKRQKKTGQVVKVTNVSILRDGEIRKEDLYVEDGKVIDPRDL